MSNVTEWLESIRFCANLDFMSNNAPSKQDSAIVRVVGYAMAVSRIIIGALILVSIVINFANIIGRYVFFSPIVWAEEVMIFIMAWCVFLGAAVVTWEGRHLRMDLLSSTLKTPWKEAINLIVVLGLIAAAGLVASQSWEAVSLFARFEQKSTTAGIPMVVPHAALLVGFGLMCLAAIVRFRAYLTGAFESEAEEVAQKFSDSDIGDRG